MLDASVTPTATVLETAVMILKTHVHDKMKVSCICRPNIHFSLLNRLYCNDELGNMWLHF